MVPIDLKGKLLCLRNQEPLWLVCVCVFSSASHKRTCCSMFCVIAMIESRVTLLLIECFHFFLSTTQPL